MILERDDQEKANRGDHAIIPAWREFCRIYTERSWRVMKYISIYFLTLILGTVFKNIF